MGFIFLFPHRTERRQGRWGWGRWWRREVGGKIRTCSLLCLQAIEAGKGQDSEMQARTQSKGRLHLGPALQHPRPRGTAPPSPALLHSRRDSNLLPDSQPQRRRVFKLEGRIERTPCYLQMKLGVTKESWSCPQETDGLSSQPDSAGYQLCDSGQVT